MRFASASSFNRCLVSASVSSSRINTGGHCVRELFLVTGMVKTTPEGVVGLGLGRPSNVGWCNEFLPKEKVG